MNSRCARLDVTLHDLVGIQRPAEARFRVGNDRHEPIALRAAFRMLDLVGARQRLVDAAAELGA
jgi:hypothetical protein